MYGSDFTATGVATHSEEGKNYFICSVDKADLKDETNKTNRDIFVNSLKNNKIEYKELEGKYNGVNEVSYLISQKHYPLYRKMLLSFGQETVLLIENHKHGIYKAFLDYIATANGKRVDFIGYLRSVPKDVAQHYASYSYDKQANTYFIVNNSDTTKLDEMEKLGLTA